MKVVFGLIFLLPLTMMAADKDPRPEMHVLAREISELQRFLLSEAEFNAKSNESSIQGSLEKMNKHMVVLEKKFAVQEDPSLRVNLSLLTTHLASAQKAFQEGNKPFARLMLKSSLQLCIACHTREKTADFYVPEPKWEGVSLMDKGEFLFATRQFEKGKKVLEDAVAAYPENKMGPYALREALLSLAIFYARVKEDPSAGAAYFKKIANRKILPLYLQKEVSDWSSDFSNWAKEGTKPKNMTELDLLLRAKRLLRSDDFSLIGDTNRKFHIRRLRASALLHQALELKTGKSLMKGEAIFYLGKIYHRISHQLFFRFGEMYLKTCIKEYPKTKIAKECYESLEEAVTEGFTGSAGTNIPDDEQVELMQLKRLAH